MTTAGAESSPTRRASRLDRRRRRDAGRGGGRDGRQQRPPRLPRERGLLEGVPAVREARPPVHGAGRPALVPRRPRAGLGVLRAPAQPLPRDGPPPGVRPAPRLGGRMPGGVFVYTSNVDGQFQKAGFDPDRVVDAHRSIHHMQCLARCGAGVFASHPDAVDVDPATMRAGGPLPSCPSCGGLARPNILMFGDGAWGRTRPRRGAAVPACWRRSPNAARGLSSSGPGRRSRPSVTSARASPKSTAGLIRVNPREAEVPDGHLGLRSGALAAITAIEAAGAGPAGGRHRAPRRAAVPKRRRRAAQSTGSPRTRCCAWPRRGSSPKGGTSSC